MIIRLRTSICGHADGDESRAFGFGAKAVVDAPDIEAKNFIKSGAASQLSPAEAAAHKAGGGEIEVWPQKKALAGR